MTPYLDWRDQAWGGALVLLMVVMFLNIGIRLLAGKRVVAVSHVVANGVATCVWRVPKTAKGRLMRGTITLTVQGTRITRPFSAHFT